MDKYETLNAADLLRDKLGFRIFPLHRLDKSTSGVLLFAKRLEGAKQLHAIFEKESTKKEYICICRGWTPKAGIIDYALRNPERPKAEAKQAITEFITLNTSTLDIPISRYLQTRLSLVAAYPKTGRTHQIRMHFAHLRNYIAGDRRHGERHLNKILLEQFGLRRLFLHAHRLEFIHPYTKETIHICTAPDDTWNATLSKTGLLNNEVEHFLHHSTIPKLL
jgi:tRNA pseudouridine65 synthase